MAATALHNTIASPEISYMNGAFIFINHCSFGFNISCSLERMVLIYLEK